jgi:hypothetical protein
MKNADIVGDLSTLYLLGPFEEESAIHHCPTSIKAASHDSTEIRRTKIYFRHEARIEIEFKYHQPKNS